MGQAGVATMVDGGCVVESQAFAGVRWGGLDSRVGHPVQHGARAYLGLGLHRCVGAHGRGGGHAGSAGPRTYEPPSHMGMLLEQHLAARGVAAMCMRCP